MMQQDPIRRDGTRVSYGAPVQESALATNKVLRSTYMLLSMTLLFSAAMAGVSMALQLPPFGLLLSLGGMFGLLILTNALRNSAAGIVAVFAFTGFMGLMMGPMLSFYIETIPNGGELVLTALAATGLVFLSLSAYVLTTGKDFSFLGGFLMVGLIGVIVVSLLGSFFFDLSAYQMLKATVVVCLMGGFILFDTSRIVNGGERNYISATVSLYLNIYIMFQYMLVLFGGSRD
jgi:modulator of FtsH protease